MLKVLIEGSGLTLDLDEISASGKGVQAVTGMTGVGLPPVDVQWFEGAGNGAVPRNIRVLPRDVDIPLHVVTDTREELKAVVAKIARVMAGKMLVKLIDEIPARPAPGGGVYPAYTFIRQAEFVRVAGGNVIYGQDTIGETEWESIVTLRAGDPFWTDPEKVVQGEGGDTHGVERIGALDNTGSAPAWPVWKISGPLTKYAKRLVSTGESFEWTGNLNYGDTLIIDTKAGTVTDQTGANRYSGLAPAPDLFALPPGTSDIGTTTVKPPQAVRRNYVLNPSFEGGTHDWQGYWVSDSTPSNLRVSVQTDPATGAKYLRCGNADIVNSDIRRTRVEKVIGNLPPGAQLQLRASVGVANPETAANAAPIYFRLEKPDYIALSITPSMGMQEIVWDFTVPANGQVKLMAMEGSLVGNGLSQWQTSAVRIDRLYIGPAGPYFDGSTTGPGFTYAWTGTPNNSQSTATTQLYPDPAGFVEFYRKEWMVV